MPRNLVPNKSEHLLLQ